jgi:photosystem II stability/assembly factor-like uncharacterized protein
MAVLVSVVFLRSGAPPANTAASTAPVPHLSGPYTATFDFIEPSHGWALVLDYTQPGSRFWIFVTLDAADHWRRQFEAAARYEGGYGPSTNVYIHFFDALHGFAYAGALYRTVDGGAHWSMVATPTDGPFFTFASATRGWILPTDWSVPPHLYATEDGGTTWTAVPTPLPPGVVVNPFAGFGFRDDGEGWLGAALSQATVFLTRDGGASWRSIPLPVSELGYDIYFSRAELLPGHGVLAIVGSPAGLVAYYSDDHGGTWRKVAALPESECLSYASFVDAVHWWVACYGFLFKTADAGADWTRVPVRQLPPGWIIQPVYAIDANHGWWSMISSTNSLESALMMTSNGGADWHAVNVPQPA